MIDTIRFGVASGRLAVSRGKVVLSEDGFPCCQLGCLPRLGSWVFNNRVGSVEKGSALVGSNSGCFIHHEATGLRGEGPAEYVIKFVEVSLPRLLYGRNSMLIWSQRELYKALSKMCALLNEVLESGWSLSHVTRLDLVWQFFGDPGEWVRAHRLLRHPKVRTRPTAEYQVASKIVQDKVGVAEGWSKVSGVEYHGTSGLVFQGREFLIRIYDKQRDESRSPGRVVRVELQLRGQTLKELVDRCAGSSKYVGLDGKDRVYLSLGGRTFDLDFDELYAYYREQCLKFEPQQEIKAGSVYELLALLEAQDIRLSNGASPLEVFLASKSKATRSRVRKGVSAAKPLCFSFSWLELLPGNSIPPVLFLASFKPHWLERPVLAPASLHLDLWSMLPEKVKTASVWASDLFNGGPLQLA
jgi:hypothetical protein